MAISYKRWIKNPRIQFRVEHPGFSEVKLGLTCKRIDIKPEVFDIIMNER